MGKPLDCVKQSIPLRNISYRRERLTVGTDSTTNYFVGCGGGY